MDFIFGFPQAEGIVGVMVVVDRFSKYETIIPFPKRSDHSFSKVMLCRDGGLNVFEEHRDGE